MIPRRSWLSDMSNISGTQVKHIFLNNKTNGHHRQDGQNLQEAPSLAPLFDMQSTYRPILFKFTPLFMCPNHSCSYSQNSQNGHDKVLTSCIEWKMIPMEKEMPSQTACIMKDRPTIAHALHPEPHFISERSLPQCKQFRDNHGMWCTWPGVAH